MGSVPDYPALTMCLFLEMERIPPMTAIVERDSKKKTEKGRHVINQFVKCSPNFCMHEESVNITPVLKYNIWSNV
jgi:hypothetical protein